MVSKEKKRLVVKPIHMRTAGFPGKYDLDKLEKQIGTPLLKYMGSELLPEADVTIIGRKITRDISEDENIGDLPHKHDVSQVFLLLGDVRLQITLEGETQIVTAPAAIFVPAGMEHTDKYLGGTGYKFGIYQGGTYDQTPLT